MQKHGSRKAVTAKDVAEACGVSQATVSYVINNSAGGRISEATRKRVLEMSREMGYCPSQSARSMRINRAMAVGVVLGGNSLSLGVSHALRGIKRRMDAAGYAQVLLSDEDDVLPGVDYLSAYRAGRIDALLFLFHDMPDELIDVLRAQHVPYLALSEQGITGEQISLPSGYGEALGDCAALLRQRGFKRVRYYSLTNARCCIRGNSTCSARRWSVCIRKHGSAVWCCARMGAPMSSCWIRCWRTYRWASST